MSILDLFSMAIKSMLKRKVRTFLTILGVVIGTAAITVMISLGVGVNMAFDQLLDQMGSTALRIQVWGNTWDPSPFEPVLDDTVVDQINSHPNVVIATPFLDSWLILRQGRYEASMHVIGIKPEAMEFLGFNVMEGENLNSSDELQIVFGSNAPFHFRNERNRNQWNWGWGGDGVAATIDLLGGRMQAGFGDESMRPYMVQPLGILDGETWETANSSFMPLAQVQEINEARLRWERSQGHSSPGSTAGYNQVQVLADDVNNVEIVLEYIQNMGITNAFSETQWINAQREGTEMLQGLLSAIGAVSLFVAAISIANTMIMSIYERTKEIGVMKVIGASIKDIRRLFLIEAALIGAIGGGLGLLLSSVVSYVINTQGLEFLGGLTWVDTSGTASSVIPVWLYMLAFFFSCVIGLVSGFLPARRATKISALAAIKTD